MNFFGSREYLTVKSGRLLIIDQFMLGNSQFLDQPHSETQGHTPLDLNFRLDESRSKDGLTTAAERYGGCVIELKPGNYDVWRDARLCVMFICSGETDTRNLSLADEGAPVEEINRPENLDVDEILSERERHQRLGRVFVDTRCLVFIDVTFLNEKQRLKEFAGQRSAGKEKEARDLLRSVGGAVRYGFNREGDELGVFRLEEWRSVGLWPDVCETLTSPE